MRSQHIGRSRRWRAATLALAVAVAGLVVTTTAAAPAQAASTWSSYAGTGTGVIADGGNPCTPGEPRVVEFEVSGMPVGPLRGVRVAGLMLTHAWVGDLTATLTAPGGSNVVLFSRTGAFVAESAGDGSHVSGPYTFSDAPTPNDWWAEADGRGESGTIPAGRYRASTPGGAEGGGAVQPITAAYAAEADPNGVWTLTITDRCFGGAGSVDAVDLQLQPSALGPGCAAYQSAVDVAAGAVAGSTAVVETARTTLVQAAEAVGVAQSSTQLAAADVARADAAVAAAEQGLSAANSRLTKAIKALKAARKSHKKARIAKATTAYKVALAKRKVAQSVVFLRQEMSMDADVSLGAANRIQGERQVGRETAVVGLASAQSALAAAVKLQAERQRELDLCLDA